MKKIFVLLFLLIGVAVNAQQQRKIIHLPDIDGYQFAKCDFHMHTIFSDGLVHPQIRVLEAWRDGLDAIAITDHQNYHVDYLDTIINRSDLNNPYEQAKTLADQLGIVLVRGCELNRFFPTGHFNFLFSKDLNELNEDDFFVDLENARKQGAFIQWNHPDYKQKHPIEMQAVHQEIIKRKLLDGIEVYNSKRLIPETLAWANENNLTITGGSDEHNLINMSYQYTTHRPMTLVLVKDKSLEDIKQSMFDRKTLVYYENTLVGKQDLLKKVFQNSIEVITPVMIFDWNKVFVQFKNSSDVKYSLELQQQDTASLLNFPKQIEIEANAVTAVTCSYNKNGDKHLKEYKAIYKITNLKSLDGTDVLFDLIVPNKPPFEVIKHKGIKYPDVKF